MHSILLLLIRNLHHSRANLHQSRDTIIQSFFGIDSIIVCDGFILDHRPQHNTILYNCDCKKFSQYFIDLRLSVVNVISSTGTTHVYRLYPSCLGRCFHFSINYTRQLYIDYVRIIVGTFEYIFSP